MFLPLCLVTLAFGLQKPKTKALTRIILDLIGNLGIYLKDYTVCVMPWLSQITVYFVAKMGLGL